MTKRTSGKPNARVPAASPCDSDALEGFDYTGLSPEFSALSKPAKRALLNQGIRTPSDLARKTLDEVLGFHGVGPSAIPVLQKALRAHRLKFKTDRKS